MQITVSGDEIRFLGESLGQTHFQTIIIIGCMIFSFGLVGHGAESHNRDGGSIAERLVIAPNKVSGEATLSELLEEFSKSKSTEDERMKSLRADLFKLWGTSPKTLESQADLQKKVDAAITKAGSHKAEASAVLDAYLTVNPREILQRLYPSHYKNTVQTEPKALTKTERAAFEKEIAARVAEQPELVKWLTQWLTFTDGDAIVLIHLLSAAQDKPNTELAEAIVGRFGSKTKGQLSALGQALQQAVSQSKYSDAEKKAMQRLYNELTPYMSARFGKGPSNSFNDPYAAGKLALYKRMMNDYNRRGTAFWAAVNRMIRRVNQGGRAGYLPKSQVYKKDYELLSKISGKSRAEFLKSLAGPNGNADLLGRANAAFSILSQYVDKDGNRKYALAFSDLSGGGGDVIETGGVSKSGKETFYTNNELASRYREADFVGKALNQEQGGQGSPLYSLLSYVNGNFQPSHVIKTEVKQAAKVPLTVDTDWSDQKRAEAAASAVKSNREFNRAFAEGRTVSVADVDFSGTKIQALVRPGPTGEELFLGVDSSGKPIWKCS